MFICGVPAHALWVWGLYYIMSGIWVLTVMSDSLVNVCWVIPWHVCFCHAVMCTMRSPLTALVFDRSGGWNSFKWGMVFYILFQVMCQATVAQSTPHGAHLPCQGSLGWGTLLHCAPPNLTCILAMAAGELISRNAVCGFTLQKPAHEMTLNHSLTNLYELDSRRNLGCYITCLTSLSLFPILCSTLDMEVVLWAGVSHSVSDTWQQGSS